MKTAWYERNGPAHSVLQVGEKPKPEPAAGEVLVKLVTSGVNPSDVKSRAGRPMQWEFIVPHSDGAGVIEAVGKGVAESRVGERVWLWNGQWQRQFGTAAEFIAVPEVQAVPLDDETGFDEAACFGIPGLTAAHAVNLAVAARAGKVLVTGAASSVGHYVTQMLSAEGLDVIATASSKKQEIALEAGAKAVIDYRSGPVAENILEANGGQGVDAVVDLDFSSTSLLIGTPSIAPHATIFCYGSNDMGDLSVPFRDLLFKSITLSFFLVYELMPEERTAAIERLQGFMRSGKAETRLQEPVPLENIAEAHALVEEGRANGNVVLRI